LGPVGVLLAALDLDELGDDMSTGLDISTDTFPLRISMPRPVMPCLSVLTLK
jgi:hypothetical protein